MHPFHVVHALVPRWREECKCEPVADAQRVAAAAALERQVNLRHQAGGSWHRHRADPSVNGQVAERWNRL